MIGPLELLDDEEAGGLEALEEVEQVQVINLILGIPRGIQANAMEKDPQKSQNVTSPFMSIAAL